MFKKVKFILMCAIVVGSTAACSSDDSSNSGSASEDYTVSVTVTEGATIEQVMAVTYSSATDIDTDINSGLETTMWSKVYKKASNQRIEFAAQGFGVDATSKINIKVTKDNKVVKEGSGAGTILSATVSF